jgi:hypothetical protein
MISWELFSKFSCVCLSLEKLLMKNTFQSKKNLIWFPRKYFYFILVKILFKSCEKFKNILLLIISNFILNILNTIYFVLNLFFFSISSLKIWFNLIFISNLILIRFDPYFFIAIFLFEIICEIVILLILSSFNFFIC